MRAQIFNCFDESFRFVLDRQNLNIRGWCEVGQDRNSQIGVFEVGLQMAFHYKTSGDGMDTTLRRGVCNVLLQRN